MNASKIYFILILIFVGLTAPVSFGNSAPQAVQQGNDRYEQQQYEQAIEKYDQAKQLDPEASEPEFNKANSYYQLNEFEKAVDLYSQVAAGSEDKELAAKAKYNLGNTFFRSGVGKSQTAPDRAIDDMKKAVNAWRQSLDMSPDNKEASRNIETAKRFIKQIQQQIQQQQNQPSDPNQPQDPNQSQDNQNQSQQGDSQEEQKDRQKNQQDPNRPQDPNQTQDPNQAQDPNQMQQQQPEQPDPNEMSPDTTAQQILDREKELKKQRMRKRRTGWMRVEKDW